MNSTLSPVERLLVAALDARAAQVTSDDLRPAAPPGGVRLPRHWFLATAGMAAAVLAVVCIALLGQFRDDPSPKIRPLAPPARATQAAPTQTPRPGAPSASPQPVTSGPARAETTANAEPPAATPESRTLDGRRAATTAPTDPSVRPSRSPQSDPTLSPSSRVPSSQQTSASRGG
jgi:hypothetical protein